MSAGGLFFLSQLALSVAYYADNLIVAQFAGSKAVASYAVVARLFDLPGMLLLMVGSALWPALAEAIARGDVGWAERGLRRLILVSLAKSASRQRGGIGRFPLRNRRQKMPPATDPSEKSTQSTRRFAGIAAAWVNGTIERA